MTYNILVADKNNVGGTLLNRVKSMVRMDENQNFYIEIPELFLVRMGWLLEIYWRSRL
jgi:hypothetical protein